MNSRFGAFQCNLDGHLDEKKDFLYGNLRSSVGCLDGVLSIQSSFERLQGRPKSLITWSHYGATLRWKRLGGLKP